MISLLTLSQNIFLQGIQLLLSFDWYRFRRSGLGRAGVQQLSNGAEEERKKEGKKFKENLIWLHSRDQSLVSCFLRSFISSSSSSFVFVAQPEQRGAPAWRGLWRHEPRAFVGFQNIFHHNTRQPLSIGAVGRYFSFYECFPCVFTQTSLFMDIYYCEKMFNSRGPRYTYKHHSG